MNKVESLPDIKIVNPNKIHLNSRNKDPGRNTFNKPIKNELFSYDKKKWDIYRTKKAEFVVNNLKQMESERNGTMSWVKQI